MTNPFNQLSGVPFDDEHYYSDGLGFSFKKALKKLVNPKEHLKFAKKSLNPKEHLKFAKKAIDPREHLKFAKKATKRTALVVKRVAKSPVGKIALIAGATIIGGPIVGKFASAIGQKMATSTLLRAGGKMLASKALPKIASFAVQQRLSKKAQQKQLDLQRQIYNTQNPANPLPAKKRKVKKGKHATLSAPVPVPPDMTNALVTANQQTAALNQQIANDPQFSSIVQNMLAQGATQQQIADAWATSDAYRKVATPQIANTIMPQIEQSLIGQGMDPLEAREQAAFLAHQTASGTVDQLQAKAAGIPTWAYAAGGGLLLMMFLNKRRG